MAPIIIDESQFPLVIAVFPHEGSIEDLQTYYTEFTNLLDRASQSFQFIVDFRDMNPLKASSKHRATAAELFKAMKPKFEKMITAEALVFGSSLIRGIYTAYDWLSGENRQHPRKYFDDMESAKRWLSQLS